MFKRLLTFAALTCAVSASAQTVSYVRPSKGKTLTVTPANYTLDIAQPFTSAVYDWTAFSAIQVRVELYLNGTPTTYTTCNNLLGVELQGATEPGGAYSRESDPASTFIYNVSGTSYTYTVGNLSPYIRVVLNSGAWFPGPPAPSFGCTAKITVVPVPFDNTTKLSGAQPGQTSGLYIFPAEQATPVLSGGLEVLGFNNFSSTTDSLPSYARMDSNHAMFTTNGVSAAPLTITAPVAVGAGGEVEVFNIGIIAPVAANDPNAFNQVRSVTVENTGTVAALCSFVATSAPVPVVTAANYSFVLKGAAVAKDGTGGSRTFNNITRSGSAIKCITAAGSTDIAVQAF